MSYEDLPAALTVPQVAEVLQVSERLVREMVGNGELSHVRLGRLVRVPRHVLVEFLAGENGATPASTGAAESTDDTDYRHAQFTTT